ncbi:MAG: hypothetical protein WCO28_12535, partial [Bacteroidota bacterium]
GSCITYSNGIAEENITIHELTAFHKELVTNNTNNDILTVNHSDEFYISETAISDIQRINFNLRDIDDIDDWSESNNNLVIYSRIDRDTLCDNLKNSLELLNKYDSIYFTDNRDVFSYCRQRSIYSAISSEKSFHDEILTIQNEQKREARNYIIFLESEQKKWEEETKKVISEKTKQVEITKKKHRENERIINESIRKVERIPAYFSNLTRSIEDCINQLNSGNKLANVRKLYNENEVLFISRIDEAKKFNDINIIQDLERNTYSQHNIPKVSNNQNPDDHQRPNQNHENKSMILMIFGGVLLLCLIFYGLWRSYNSLSNQQIIEQEEKNNKIELNENNATITHMTEPKTLFTLNRATFWDNNIPSQFNGDIRGNSISVKGKASKGGAGIVNDGRIMLGGSEKIIITVKNASSDGNIFDEGRLFKLEIDHNVLQTKNMNDLCNMDSGYLSAKDGTYEFPLSNDTIKQGYIDKFQIIFYNCTIAALDLTISLE